MGKSNLVRFDWAAKRLLRNKSNFVVLEGFCPCFLEDEIHIERILESEGNQQKFDDKFNRVDMLAENSKGELVIIRGFKITGNWIIFTGCCTGLPRRLRNI